MDKYDINELNTLLKAMKDGSRLEAVKAYRSLTGIKLKEAAKVIEDNWTYERKLTPD